VRMAWITTRYNQRMHCSSSTTTRDIWRRL
jgi:hypothetical protein